jgi:hypothetical protein
MKIKDIIFFGIILLAAALCRLVIPDSLPNFSPIAAIALFSGACISDRRLSLALPLAALFLSDLVLGLHGTMLFTYAGFLGVFLIGRYFKPSLGLSMIMTSLAGSVFFYLLTNFGYWLLYAPEKTLGGIYKAYFDAIPFFRNTVAGDLFFSTILFGFFFIYIKITVVRLEKSVVTK